MTTLFVRLTEIQILTEAQNGNKANESVSSEQILDREESKTDSMETKRFDKCFVSFLQMETPPAE